MVNALLDLNSFCLPKTNLTSSFTPTPEQVSEPFFSTTNFVPDLGQLSEADRAALAARNRAELYFEKDKKYQEEKSLKEVSRFGDGFRNEYGCLRVGCVRHFLNEKGFPVPDIVAAFREWLNTPEWVRVNKETEFKDGHFDNEIIYLPAIKRGSDAYQQRINAQIAGMGEFSKANLDAVGSRDDLKTRVLFVTLTYGTNRFGEHQVLPAKRAWRTIGKDFNKWASAVRQRYGKFAYFRVWESSAAAFPHVHLIMVFEKKTFSGFMHQGKRDQKWKLRIKEKKFFEKCWHSNVDVEGVVNFKRGMSELLKYLKKSVSQQKKKNIPDGHKCFLDSEKGELTLAMNWFFNKQQYAVSGFFAELIEKTDSITDLPNSNIVVEFPHSFQQNLWDSDVVAVRWTLLDVVPFDGGDAG